MERLVIVGSTGGTGRQLVEQVFSIYLCPASDTEAAAAITHGQ